jgi:hypothetical protein
MLSALATLPAAGSTTPSAIALLVSANKDALAGGAVHEVAKVSLGSRASNEVNDVGTDEGHQVISLSNGATTAVLAFESLKVAYTEGNKLGLETYFGFPAADATIYAQKWMKITPTSAAWNAVTTATTLQSDFTFLPHVKSPIVSAHVSTVDGQRVFKVSGHLPASGKTPAATVVLYLSDGAKPLPVQMIQSIPNGHLLVNWTKWGQPLHLSQPAHSVPLP